MSRRYASVYPLLTSRTVARPFTYEVPEGVEPGTVVAVRFGGAKRRGVVTEVGPEPPEGIEATPIDRVVDSVPPTLVDLALWVAGYYGSTPGRALALVAPRGRIRRRAPEDSRTPGSALDGEVAPERLTRAQQDALAAVF